MGQVSLTWDDERTSRDELLAAMSRAGFREVEPVSLLDVVARGRVAPAVAARHAREGGPSSSGPSPRPMFPCCAARSSAAGSTPWSAPTRSAL